MITQILLAYASAGCGCGDIIAMSGESLAPLGDLATSRLRCFDAETGKEVLRVVEANAVEGWYRQYPEKVTISAGIAVAEMNIRPIRLVAEGAWTVLQEFEEAPNTPPGRMAAA